MRDSARGHKKVLIGLTLAYLIGGVCGWHLLPQNAEAQLADTIIYNPPKRGPRRVRAHAPKPGALPPWLS
jgi:hypothetical protein